MAPKNTGGDHSRTPVKERSLDTVASSPQTPARVGKIPKTNRHTPLTLEEWTPEMRRVKPVRPGVLLARDLAKLPKTPVPADMVRGEDIPYPAGLEDEDEMMEEMDPESRRLALETDRLMREKDQGVRYGSFAESSSASVEREDSEQMDDVDKIGNTNELEEDTDGGEDEDEDFQESLKEVGLMSAKKHVSENGKDEYIEKFWMNAVGQIVRIDPDDPEAPTACNSIAKAKLKSKSVVDPNGRFIGRHLVNWHRPRMMEKLILCMQYELHRAGVAIPWDKIIHRLNPGSSGPTATQMLNKMREVLIREGHFIPPAMGKRNQKTDPMIRGYIRDESVPDDDRAARVLYWTEPHEHLKAADTVSTGSGAYRKTPIKAEHEYTQTPTKAAASSARNHGSVKKTHPRIKSEPLDDDPFMDDDSDEEYSPRASRAQRSFRGRPRPHVPACRPRKVVRLPIAVEISDGPGTVRQTRSSRRARTASGISPLPARRAALKHDRQEHSAETSDMGVSQEYMNTFPQVPSTSVNSHQSLGSGSGLNHLSHAGGAVQITRPMFDDGGGFSVSPSIYQSQVMQACDGFDHPVSFGNPGSHPSSGFSSQSSFSSNSGTRSGSGIGNRPLPSSPNSFGPQDGDFGFGPHNDLEFVADHFGINSDTGFGGHSMGLFSNTSNGPGPIFGSMTMDRPPLMPEAGITTQFELAQALSQQRSRDFAAPQDPFMHHEL